MENYFILLELPFDPPESDTDKISAAIAKKQAQWSRDLINPVKKAKASEYLACLVDIRKVMLDPAARNQEAAKAKQLKNSKAEELEARLKLYRAKGDTLSDNDLKHLIGIFGVFGFSEEEIANKFQSGVKKETKIGVYEVLDRAQAKNITNLMQQLNLNDKTLYDFLELAPTSSCEQLCEAADAMKKKILAKGDKSGQDNAAQSLCGLCIIVFKDDANKSKYDNYVRLTKYGLLNEVVDELALSAQKQIEPSVKESLIGFAVGQYKLNSADASIYINNYCEYMGYSLPDNKVICGICGTSNLAGMAICLKCGKPLKVICPTCGAENHNSAKTCARCGDRFAKTDIGIFNANNSATDYDLSAALGYLKSNAYDKALAIFEKAIASDCDDAECFFYAAVCLLKGKKAFLQTRPIIDKIVGYIDSAIELDPKGMYYYFLAYVKYDYFARKFYNTSPNYKEVLLLAKQAGTTDNDVIKLFDILHVEKPSCF